MPVVMVEDFAIDKKLKVLNLMVDASVLEYGVESKRLDAYLEDLLSECQKVSICLTLCLLLLSNRYLRYLEKDYLHLLDGPKLVQFIHHVAQ